VPVRQRVGGHRRELRKRLDGGQFRERWWRRLLGFHVGGIGLFRWLGLERILWLLGFDLRWVLWGIGRRPRRLNVPAAPLFTTS
jgi:hypothetical protein